LRNATNALERHVLEIRFNVLTPVQHKNPQLQVASVTRHFAALSSICVCSQSSASFFA
jgi:hypothetical protein